MKKGKLLIVVLWLIGLSANAQDVWLQKANYSGSSGERGFSIGNKGYVGLGYNNYRRIDFWQWDPTTNIWTQMADFTGPPRLASVGFSIGAKGYIATGIDSPGFVLSDLWEYDQGTNIWTQRADLPTFGRSYATAFSIGNFGYIAGGEDISGGPEFQDLWEYNQATDTWTQKADMNNSRSCAVGFSIGTKGYIGTGFGLYNNFYDFWEWDQTTNIWTRKADYPGGAIYAAAGFAIGTKGYLGTGKNFTNNNGSFYEWDQLTNTWTIKTNFGGGPTYGTISFSIGSRGYIKSGNPNFLEFWEYNPDTTTGINNISLQSFNIDISPNPFTTQTMLTLQGTYHNPSLFIYNLLGQEVKSIHVGTNKQLTINREQLPAGMYFYKLIEDNKEVLGVGKLLVE